MALSTKRKPTESAESQQTNKWRRRFALRATQLLAYGLIKYNFGGAHLEIQDGHRAKCIFCIAPQLGQDRNVVLVAAYIVGVDEKDGSIRKLFCGGHCEIQDGRHI